MVKIIQPRAHRRAKGNPRRDYQQAWRSFLEKREQKKQTRVEVKRPQGGQEEQFAPLPGEPEEEPY